MAEPSSAYVLCAQVTVAAAVDLATRTEGTAFVDESLVLGPSSLTRASPGTVIEQVTADIPFALLPVHVRQECRLRRCWLHEAQLCLKSGTSLQEHGARGSFNWQKNWYPVQLVENLDAKASGLPSHAAFPTRWYLHILVSAVRTMACCRCRTPLICSESGWSSGEMLRSSGGASRTSARIGGPRLHLNESPSPPGWK